MKKLFFVLLVVVAMSATGCANNNEPQVEAPTLYTYEEWKEVTTFEDVTTTFDNVENVHASPEYWEELAYNSRKNEW